MTTDTTNLTTLTGSEKQIAWASDIRAKAISEFDALIALSTDKCLASGKYTREQIDARNAEYSGYFGNVLANTAARFWIDNQCSTQDYLKIGKGDLPATRTTSDGGVIASGQKTASGQK